jgi:SAM-dependent methyltransferase
VTAPEWNERYLEDARVRRWASTPNRVLLAEAGSLRPGRALDLACGMGRNAVWLAEQGWAVTAVDFSDVAVDAAKERAREHGVELDVVLADLLGYEPPGRAFDLVVVFFLQLPRDELRLVLGRAAEALAPGGTFLLVGHDRTNLEDGVGGPRDPSVLYTPGDVVAALDGLEIARAERLLRDIDGEDRPAIDCLVRATRPGPP